MVQLTSNEGKSIDTNYVSVNLRLTTTPGTSPFLLNRFFKIQRRDRNENVKKKKKKKKAGLINKRNNFARASHFFVHFFTFFARLCPENA